MTTDDTQVYITGVLYNSDAFPSDPAEMFAVIDGKFREITLLTYGFLCINRAENRFSGGTTREQLLIFMKDITYNSDIYLSDTNSAALRTDLINKLATIASITYTDVEIRTTRAIS